jgi:hypothetical protein
MEIDLDTAELGAGLHGTIQPNNRRRPGTASRAGAEPHFVRSVKEDETEC